MVNLAAASQKPLLHGLMKVAGIIPHTLEIDPGTVMKTTTTSITNAEDAEADIRTTKPARPVVVLVHGFASNGIVTWLFRVRSLTRQHCVMCLTCSSSGTDNPDSSPTFQADCLVKGLRKLGIERCTVVGFSYGGIVAFNMAELYPEMVEALLISGSVLVMADSISRAMQQRHHFSPFSEFLLPTSLKGCKAQFKVAPHKKLWIPDRFYKDFLEVMFNNRKERAELLEGLVASTKVTSIPNFPQAARRQGYISRHKENISRHKESRSSRSPRKTLCP